MPRYMVERTFPDGLQIPVTEEGAAACLGVVGKNADVGVTWVHSYVSEDKQTTFCIYDGPNPGSDSQGCPGNGLPLTASPTSRCSIPISYP